MTQREQVLKALRAAGAMGVSNGHLNTICFRYAARIHELRQRGYAIRTQSGNDGLRIYFLEAEPSPQPVTPSPAPSNQDGDGEQAALFQFPSRSYMDPEPAA